MKVIDPGHIYELDMLDTTPESIHILIFVKREGEKYPGNVGHHAGTNLQEVLRACIDRLRYVDHQEHAEENRIAIAHLRGCIFQLEIRAAKRHGREFPDFWKDPIEKLPTCKKCGHIGCEGECH